MERDIWMSICLIGQISSTHGDGVSLKSRLPDPACLMMLNRILTPAAMSSISFSA